MAPSYSRNMQRVWLNTHTCDLLNTGGESHVKIKTKNKPEDMTAEQFRLVYPNLKRAISYGN